MNITLKNIKHSAFASQETECFQATVCIDGKKVGEVSNDGRGGCNSYYPHQIYQLITDHAKTLPEITLDGLTAAGTAVTVVQDADILIGNLLNHHLEVKHWKRACSGKTIFRIDSKTYGDGVWTALKTPFTPELKAALIAKNGPCTFMNEQINH